MAHETQTAPGMAVEAAHGEHGAGRLGPFLCWAVVFADIGTSVYYVPGILYGQVGRLAGLFVTLTLVAFLLLTLKYAEVSVRFPEGGGVVSVAARGLNPWAGAVGGMFILTSYFLTSAISARSGVEYLQSLVPGIGPYVLVVTLVLMALLGVLNWYGVKESATVSLYIAVAAFVSDLAILALIVVKVPPSVIGQVIAHMFSGEHLGPATLLTGFAGAFLAFSGLESISQLSPVMRLPRRRVVSSALALVAITVIATSPLLTIFSTTLLTDPSLLAAAHLNVVAAPKPDQFISQLAFVSGGRVLEVLTAVTASTLLVFASNTAIIGAYHVFLALSRMQFFPKAIERTNRLRGTPHVSILLATGIPMLVLVAVAGNIAVLGELYAFGLLGAFSLTCVALDVIRWRERRGGEYTGEHEEREATARGALRSVQTLPFLEGRLDPAAMERLWHLRHRMRVRRAALARQTRPAVAFLRRAWPGVNYYLGFATTALVTVAWAVNLGSKPLATAFGGGLTVLGVGVAVVHYRYQQAKGERPVFLMAGLRRMPDSLLVVLSPRSSHSAEVVRVACSSADERTLVFLYLGQPAPHPVRPLEIVDPYFYDDEAHRTLALAAAISSQARVGAQFVYKVAGPTTVQDVWRILQPSEIIADSALGKEAAKQVAPEYVRFQQVDGVRVSHLITHQLPPAPHATHGGPVPAAARKSEASERSAVAGGAFGSAARGPAGAASGGAPGAARGGLRGERPEPASGGQRPEPASGGQRPAEPVVEPAPVDIQDYVWTGTDLVRRDELERAGGPPPGEGDAGESGRGEAGQEDTGQRETRSSG